MLSKKTKYGLKALIYLTRHYTKGPVLITDLAASEHIPRKFLETILLELKNRGVLQSKKGPGGGYSLARPPRDIKLGEIVRWLNGPLAPVSCVSQTAYRRCEECADENSCGIQIVMKDVRDAIAQILDSTSFDDIVRRIQEQTEKDIFNFII